MLSERTLKVTFICCFFPPELEAGATMARQLARRLVSDGHDLSVVAPFPNRPFGRLYQGFRRRLYQSESSSEGYRLIRCVNWLVGSRRRKIDRLLENITFGLAAALAAWRQGCPDVLIVETWPLFAVYFAVTLARWWRVPLVYYVKDVYPEALESLGFIRPGGRVARVCRALDKHLCRHSARIVVISESMRDLMSASRGIAADRFAVIPDWLDAADFAPQATDNEWRREQRIAPETFVAMFGGSLGFVSGVEMLVEVAQLLRHKPEVLIVCVGEGVCKQRMIRLSSQLGLENLRFLPFQPRERIAEVQGAADVTLLTMRQTYSDASVPTKLISYMAVGRPVICATPADSTSARIVRDSGAGLLTKPGDTAAMADAITYLSRNPTEVQRRGESARSYFEKHLTLDRAHKQFAALLREVASEGFRQATS